MHVDHLSIAFLPTNSRRNNHQGVFCNEVPYTSFVFRAVARVGLKIKLQCGGKGKDGEAAQYGEEAISP